MATQVQNRRGSTAEHSTFTGAAGELTVDTDKDTVVVHDGGTAGGAPLMREDGSNSSLALGSAASPSLKWDSNTGIYSPGTDQVAISSNAVQRVNFGTSEVVFNDGGENYDFRIEGDTEPNLVFVDASTNRVGLGTSSPGAKFQINTQDGFRFDVGTNAYSYMQFGSAGAGEGTAEIGFERTSGKVYLKNTISGSLSTAFTLDGSGRVGIGTTSPGSTLTVNGTARIQNTASFVGINIKNDNDSSSVTTTSFIDASNNLGTIDGHLFFEHLPSGGSSAYIATTPAGDRATDRRVTRLTVGFNGTTTVNSAASTAPFIALINGAESARIDSSGRLLVGTSTARGVATSSNQNNRIQIADVGGNSGGISTYYYSADGGSNTWNFCKSRGASEGSFTVVNSGDTLGTINWIGSDGNGFSSVAASIFSAVDATPGANDMPGRLVFSTTADGASSPTERFRIISSGALVLGGGAASSNGSVTLYPNNDSGTATADWRRAATANSAVAIRFFDGTTQVGSITYSNTATAYNTSSDYRLKENVVPLTGAANRLNQLQVKRFNFIADPDKTVDGFIAHEAQAVVPECVTGTKDEVDDEGNPVYQGIDQSKLVPLLTAALQEALAEIESLKARLTAAGI